MSADDQLTQKRAFGKGLALVEIDPGQDIGLDIALTPSAPEEAGSRDLMTQAGIDTLIQDLTVAMTIGLGTDPLNTTFGNAAFRAMAEISDPLLRRESIRIAIINVLSADPRVGRIRSVRFRDESSVGAARTIALNVVAEFETVLGNTLSIDIEG